MARLYLISDILHNCSVKGPTNVSFYRLGFQAKFPEIFADLRDYHKSIDSRMKAESFKQRVMSCFKAWEDWALYPQMELIKYQNIFLGLVDDSNNGDDAEGKEDEDVDGNSMSDDDDVDGIPLDGAALLKASKGASFNFQEEISHGKQYLKLSNCRQGQTPRRDETTAQRRLRL